MPPHRAVVALLVLSLIGTVVAVQPAPAAVDARQFATVRPVQTFSPFPTIRVSVPPIATRPAGLRAVDDRIRLAAPWDNPVGNVLTNDSATGCDAVRAVPGVPGTSPILIYPSGHIDFTDQGRSGSWQATYHLICSRYVTVPSFRIVTTTSNVATLVIDYAVYGPPPPTPLPLTPTPTRPSAGPTSTAIPYPTVRGTVLPGPTVRVLTPPPLSTAVARPTRPGDTPAPAPPA